MRVLAVCGFGVGSSMALRMQVEKALKELGVDAEVDNTDIASAASQTPDLIYTSPEFAEQLESQVTCPIVAIKEFMNYQEVLQASKSQLQND
ncbi:PTS sugar transporter subunit IIB [Paenalkalicoccus suaedae]|uniref:PTS sugar transporter subunit IIB n=1 Tax=Paenalkalicoccus suaedae TaxID=2592382 RepID=A0A859FAJ8_9BACI|nr:PTS sugar transporter subunit IIB [Paenalkalicoccus suaedae]QKS69792.1 PTS sugar transporter subunit IIB [Paenalkalicoccus suaedae]